MLHCIPISEISPAAEALKGKVERRGTRVLIPYHPPLARRANFVSIHLLTRRVNLAIELDQVVSEIP